MPATYSMNRFIKQYKTFASPQYSIKVENKNLSAKFCNKNIVIDIPASYEASTCVFYITNAFKLQSAQTIELDQELKREIKLGAKVEVSIGYEDVPLKNVFKGYIDAIYLDYTKDEEICYTVECLDAKGLMMNQFGSEVKTNTLKYSAAVEDLIKNYGPYVKIGSNINRTDANVGFPIEQHNESDYDFVVRLAKKLDYSFYIINGELYFEPKNKTNKQPLMFEFHINELLLGLKVHSSMRNQVRSVTVRSNNEKNPNSVFESKAASYHYLAQSGTGQASQISSAITARVTKTVIDPTIDSVEKAKNLADSLMNEITYGLVTATVTTVGIPDFTPGNIVSLKGFGTGFDRDYFVKKVIHKIRHKKYTTDCILESNQPSAGSLEGMFPL